MQSITKHFFLLTVLSTILISQSGWAQSWNKIGITSPATGWAGTPAIAIDKTGMLYASFLNINTQACVMKFDGSSWTTVGSAYISAGIISNCGEPAPIVTDTGGVPYIAYPDT